jgi:thiosulfate dehydrogenase [quinone] large subunit
MIRGEPAAEAPKNGALARIASVVRAPGGALLILRAFLGVTFLYAGLQKLANPSFFNAAAPGSFQQQLRGSILTSPLHNLLDPALHASTLLAIVISFGEIAVGLGTLLGLFGRVAAVGGMLLSLSFFLTVSYNDSPYYYGPDIVFLFAWTPFAIAGSGAWSLDGRFAARSARSRALRHSATVPDPAGVDRRIFLQKLTLAGVLGAVGLAAGGFAAAIGRLAGGSPSPTGSVALGGAGSGRKPASTTTSPPTTTTRPLGPGTTSPATTGASGVAIGRASDVPIGGAARFTDPAEGTPALVVQEQPGEFRAFSAVCPHAGCTVAYVQQNRTFVCPCHGSVFSGTDGAVEQGPATSGLSSISVALGANGELYVDG